jgi:streptogrisin C
VFHRAHRTSRVAATSTLCLLACLLLFSALASGHAVADVTAVGLGGYPAPAPKTTPLGALQTPLQLKAPNAAAAISPAAVDQYVKTYNVNRAEAVRRMLLQTKVKDLEGKLVAALGDSYAQNWFDNDTGKQVVAVGPGGDTAKAAAALESLGYSSEDIKVARVPFGYRDMGAALDEVGKRATSALGRGGFELAIEPGRLVLRTTADDPPSESLAEGAGRAPIQIHRGVNDVARPESCSFPYCNPHVAGTYWYGPGGGCTQGFLSTAGGGYYYMSAGHCVAGSSPVAGNGTRWNSCGPGPSDCEGAGGYWASGYYQTGAEDMGIHQWTGPTSSPGVWALSIHPGFANWWNSQITTITGAQNPQVGSYLCYNGSTTGSSCGTVAAVNQSVTYQYGPTVAGMIAIDGACTQPGDSGGPWTYANVAWAAAIHSGGTIGGCPKRSYAAVVGTISSVMGVSIVTG